MKTLKKYISDIVNKLPKSSSHVKYTEAENKIPNIADFVNKKDFSQNITHAFVRSTIIYLS